MIIGGEFVDIEGKDFGGEIFDGSTFKNIKFCNFSNCKFKNCSFYGEFHGNNFTQEIPIEQDAVVIFENCTIDSNSSWKVNNFTNCVEIALPNSQGNRFEREDFPIIEE